MFGQDTNDPNKPANATIRYMVACMFGEPQFLFKMLHVRQLKVNCLFDRTNILLNNEKESEVNGIAITYDGTRVIQTLLKKFDNHLFDKYSKKLDY